MKITENEESHKEIEKEMNTQDKVAKKEQQTMELFQCRSI